MVKHIRDMGVGETIFIDVDVLVSAVVGAGKMKRFFVNRHALGSVESRDGALALTKTKKGLQVIVPAARRSEIRSIRRPYEQSHLAVALC